MKHILIIEDIDTPNGPGINFGVHTDPPVPLNQMDTSTLGFKIVNICASTVMACLELSAPPKTIAAQPTSGPQRN